MYHNTLVWCEWASGVQQGLERQKLERSGDFEPCTAEQALKSLKQKGQKQLLYASCSRILRISSRKVLLLISCQQVSVKWQLPALQVDWATGEAWKTSGWKLCCGQARESQSEKVNELEGGHHMRSKYPPKSIDWSPNLSPCSLSSFFCLQNPSCAALKSKAIICTLFLE